MQLLFVSSSPAEEKGPEKLASSLVQFKANYLLYMESWLHDGKKIFLSIYLSVYVAFWLSCILPT